MCGKNKFNYAVLSKFIFLIYFAIKITIKMISKKRGSLKTWKHSSSDYRCSNQTLVTIVGTIVRFEVRLCFTIKEGKIY